MVTLSPFGMSIYIYIYICLLLSNICIYILIMRIYYINPFVGIWNRLWISLHMYVVMSLIMFRLNYICVQLIYSLMMTITIFVPSHDDNNYICFLSWRQLLYLFPLMTTITIFVSSHDDNYYICFLSWRQLLYLFPLMMTITMFDSSHDNNYYIYFLSWGQLLYLFPAHSRSQN